MAQELAISIHALLAESDSRNFLSMSNVCISIHALLAESDAHHFPALHDIFISIHALLAESDSMLISLFCGCSDFYPRSPCGERLAP